MPFNVDQVVYVTHMNKKVNPEMEVVVEAERRTAFVISPIGNPGSESQRKANLALNFIFRKAFDEGEWNVHRADDGDTPDSIGQHVIKSIVNADLVIADLTDHNPNVFYELAVAHGYRKPVVHMITTGQKIPFDLTDQRTISYDLTDPSSVDAAIRKLKSSSVAALNAPEDLITPLSSFDSFESLRQSLGDNTGASVLADVIEQVTARLSGVESKLALQAQEFRMAEMRRNFEGSREVSDHVADPDPRVLLSQRERRILKLVGAGATDEQIMERLELPDAGYAQALVNRLGRKLNVDGRDGILTWLSSKA